ncbi:hypothetical protein IKS86_05190 [bacterium]|nr:hypothetical protein [bacterium]
MNKIFLILFALLMMGSCGGDAPEADAAQGSLGGICYPNKTCDDGLECSEDGNICVKKDSNGDIDNPTDPANNDSDADSGDSENSSDNDSSDSVSDNDPAENEAGCGNGVKEAGEVCEKGEYVTCSEVNSEYSASNFATCNDYCNGWNTANCENSQEGAQPLASFPARTHELTYLYNGLTAFEEMANQEDELWKSALFNASVTMSGETYSIPNPLANVHWIAAYYDSDVLSFYQNSYACDDSMNCQYATPAVMFGAALSALKAGKELSIGISDENQVNMLIEDVMTNSEQDCVMLVGYGTLKVDSINISSGSAGNFKFTTSKIGLYLPAATPEGDVTNELENAGFTICK